MDSPQSLPLSETPSHPATGSSASPGAAPARFRYATTALALGLLVLGVFWRLIDLGYPRSFAFDEHHFVRNARNYMVGQPDWNDHPPLGKLLLVPTMHLFGDAGVGWRLPSALLGLALIVLAGLIAAKIFESPRVGLLAAAFVAVDGFFISYARVALLDTPMTAFIYGALAFMLWASSLWWFAGAAVCVGLAVATKWTGVCVMLVAPWLLWRGKRAPWHAVWMFGLACLVYVGVVALAWRITRQPFTLSGLLISNVSLLKHHAGFTVWDNAASSRWYTWPFLTHPILMHYEAIGPTSLRATTSLGNVLLWFGTTAAVVSTIGTGIRRAWRGRRSRGRGLAQAVQSVPLGDWARRADSAGPPEEADRAERAHQPDRDVPAIGPTRAGRSSRLGGRFALVTMLALILPFVLTRRQSYIFHYLGAYGLGLGLLARWLVEIEARSFRTVLAFVGLAAAVSIAYAPLWTNALVSKGGFLVRLPFPGWH